MDGEYDFLFFDPITSEMPVPEEGSDAGCGGIVLYINREWLPIMEAVLRRLEEADAWEGTQEDKARGIDMASILIERLFLGDIEYG